MDRNERQQESVLKDLNNRLKILGLLIKINNDLFKAQSYDDALRIAANTPHSLIRFKYSAIFEKSGSGDVKLIGQFTQGTPNANSILAYLQTNLCRDIEVDDYVILEPNDIENTTINGLSLSEAIGEDSCLLIYALNAPPFLSQAEGKYIWIMELDYPIPNYTLSVIKLIANVMSNALYSRKYSIFSNRKSLWQKLTNRKWLTFSAIVALLFVISLFRVPESVNAEFEIKPVRSVETYAWIDGPIGQCYKQNGDKVTKDELIVEYDTKALKFKIANAKSMLNELEKELELETKGAFVDRSKLGQLKLLEAKIASAKVDLEEAQWYLEKSKLYAKESGILVLEDERAEQLEHRTVRTGERIFRIHAEDQRVAEILLNEKDSSILSESMGVELFLYTSPEKGIKTKVLEIGTFPQLTEQKFYAYKVRAELLDGDSLRYGMRGIAKLHGKNVSIGYYLFKSAILYLRRI